MADSLALFLCTEAHAVDADIRTTVNVYGDVGWATRHES
jgi:hypothetical protein